MTTWNKVFQVVSLFPTHNRVGGVGAQKDETIAIVDYTKQAFGCNNELVLNRSVSFGNDLSIERMI